MRRFFRKLAQTPAIRRDYGDSAFNRALGQRGREAIGRFYDTFAAGQEGMDFEVHYMIPCGSEAACFVTMTFHMKDSTSPSSKMINIYKMSPGGKIASLRSFWRMG